MLEYGTKIIQQQALAASFDGGPTDIAYDSGRLAVIDGAGAISHLSVFQVDGDGGLIRQSYSIINSPANGIAVIDDSY